MFKCLAPFALLALLLACGAEQTPTQSDAPAAPTAKTAETPAAPSAPPIQFETGRATRPTAAGYPTPVVVGACLGLASEGAPEAMATCDRARAAAPGNAEVEAALAKLKTNPEG